MDEQTLTEEKNNSKDKFFARYGWLMAAFAAVVAILFLFAPVVVREIDDVKTNVYLWNYFSMQNKFDWTIFLPIGLLVLGIVFLALHRVIILDSVASLLFIVAIPLLALSKEFYDANSIENCYVSFGWGSACSIGFTAVAALLSLSSEFSNKTITTREIAEDGILIAAAFILNLIKIPIANQGGSINFQMLPLFLIALRHGPGHGLICGGVIYGLLTCLTDGWGFASYPFDYLIGFGSCMIMGLFARFILSENQKWYNLKGLLFLFIAGTVSTFLRFVGSCSSSIIVYGASFQFALTYNAIYIPISGLIATAVIMAAYGPLLNIHNMFPVKKSVN